jgi:Uma2 family endonuclease
MAARSLPLSLEEFHSLYDDAKPAYEYWYGTAVQKPMPPVLHGLVQFVLMTLLERAGWNPSSEVRLKVVSDAEPVPDVIAVRGRFKGQYPTAAPELCVEIMSRGTPCRERLIKLTVTSIGELNAFGSSIRRSGPHGPCRGKALRSRLGCLPVERFKSVRR